MAINISQSAPPEAGELWQAAAACFQCGRCTGGCPVIFAARETPRQVIRFLQLGAWEKALASPTIWVCAGCHFCTVECPRGVDLQGLMVRLKQLALSQGKHKKDAAFYQAFLMGIKRKGRIFEPELLLAYVWQAGVNVLRPQVKAGIQMLRRGQVTLRPSLVEDRLKLRALLETLTRGGREG
ncbi:4Fe-4S dicluster domain-containing protein [Moorella naiadis]|uniref:4Fe-4S dicluster domain-containing protein n=1 Tax=Moorella naiadis (nom. illeg.) TaxID=3093670 RepID=UPI003D9C8B2D